MNSAAYLFFLANTLYSLSYLVRDILWLRAFAILAAVTSLPYFYLQPQPLYWALFWQSTFLLINLVHAAILVRERMPVAMDQDQMRLQRLAFSHLTSRELLRISHAADWGTAEAGEVLLHNGDISGRLLLVFHGILKVTGADGSVRAHLRDGQFAGEMSLITGKPHSSDVIAAETTRYLSWDWAALNALWRRHPNIQKAFETLIGQDMAGKLEGG